MTHVQLSTRLTTHGTANDRSIGDPHSHSAANDHPNQLERSSAPEQLGVWAARDARLDQLLGHEPFRAPERPRSIVGVVEWRTASPCYSNAWNAWNAWFGAGDACPKGRWMILRRESPLESE